MERRLIPVNGVLALLRADGGTTWPNDLATQGLQLHLLEADVYSTPQSVRVDVMAYRADPDVIVLFECKSGRNISPSQARGYCNATFDGVKRRTTVPAALRGRSDVAVLPVFVGLADDGEALVESMAREGIEAPLLLVGAQGATLERSTHGGLSDFASRGDDYGLPPGRIVVDADSPSVEIRELLVQQVGAALSRGDAVLGMAEAAATIHPYWASVARPAQAAFVERLKEAARDLARTDLKQDLRYESDNHVNPRLVVLANPVSADPRGAPQAWQALGRRAAQALGRTQRPQIEGQLSMSFDDLDPEPRGDEDAS